MQDVVHNSIFRGEKKRKKIVEPYCSSSLFDIFLYFFVLFCTFLYFFVLFCTVLYFFVFIFKLYFVPATSTTIYGAVCMYGHTYSKSMDQPGKAASPARGQLNREN